MAKLSYYSTVTGVLATDYLFTFRSGVTDNKILISDFASGIFPSQSGQSGKIIATDGSGFKYVASGAGGGGTPGGSSGQIQYHDGSTFGGSSRLTWDGTNFSVTGSGRFDYFRVNSGMFAGANNSVNIGSASTTFGSGYFKAIYADNLVASSISGGFVHPFCLGYSFPSGTVTSTGTNVSYEIPFPIRCTLASGAGYATIRSKTVGSGNISGTVVDLRIDNVSIWSVNSGNRLTMPNNSRSGSQSSFDHSGIIEKNSYLTVDFLSICSGVYANDIVIELLTMAQK